MYVSSNVMISACASCIRQGRQTRQNSGGVACLTKEGLQFFLNCYAIKISTF